MITLNKINLRRGQHLLLEEVQWTIFHKQRIGLIGANGSGKSSLFSMLLGQIQPDSGELELPRKLKIAHVAQETPAYAKSALDYVLEGDTELKQLEQALQVAEVENDGAQIAIIHARMGEIGAYSAPARAAQLLNGLGFNKSEQQQPVSDFSGGWRVRLNLAKALIAYSDILLLDEPTNHLDLDAIIWLENWLRHYTGTLLLISHDREFLDNIVDHVAHIEHKNLKLYAGNYSDFEKQRAIVWSNYWDNFKQQIVRNYFLELNAAWTNHDLSKVRHLISDRLYEANSFWMALYKQNGWNNRLDDLKIQNIELVKIELDKYYETITVRVFASCFDYTEDTHRKIIGGSKKNRRAYTEYWTFARRAGVEKTEVVFNLNACPQCGAAADKMGQSAICEYCGSKISTGEFSWVLFLITQDENYCG